MSVDAKPVRLRLEALRRELESLDYMSSEARQTVQLDQQSVGRISRVDALQRQAMAEATSRNRAVEIRRIDLALTRLGEDEYGWCEACGEEIAEKRLAIDPAAALCIACAAKGER
ncbi:hypothetical protein MNBD_ALPHA09-996 [hydrothermal vent metagenome]|uniref:Zinc finger DksA/TraR C4-type domain-containing protein n=1 Tax=hydrothermal vent metagenome TaxID=652676 RepID=A0A3B0TCH9_9ZZZZ